MSPIAYAHRGFSPAGAENSLAAFRAAVELGFHYLETDSRVSADGVAFAFHDDRLDRVTNSTGRLVTSSADVIRRARILGREPIPELSELLAAFPHVHWNIDVKSHAAIGPTLDALRTSKAESRVRLAAFSHSRLIALRDAAGPTVATGMSPPEILRLKTASQARGPFRQRLLASLRRGKTGDMAAQVPAHAGWLPLVDRAFVAQSHDLGIAVHVWTINRRAEMIRLLDLGVDGIMTDRADLLREVLRERGEWNQ
ncbi:glycerophosphodiester phosphodiesterase [Jatrophihabitans telluris]|uniref:Glycerophosphodiester phosphodiesterase n=1 Tax=Jatrophihabitans telluris TaxID=2038343 RepID=A0ABY4QRY0_9ACTN|nr:glycerophosphodiester phosphodiesterase family protein [Jatrophihabitans telluris]UQX86673.1 glycerophosphodiester phosphodiesterase [Jatrophihabitans telluris]